MAKDLLDKMLDKLVGGDFRGWIGEKATEWELNFARLLGKNGKILRNLYVPKENGETSEIDVIFITEKGIFVIESKNYSGWIFGDEKGYYWTAMLPNGTKNKFYNPIKQNRTHIKWLNHYLNNEIPLFSIIAFSERCELKKVCKKSEDFVVIKRDRLYSEIRKKWEEKESLLDDTKIEELYIKLSKLTDVDFLVKEKHILNIQNNKACCLLNDNKEEKKQELENICPKCGSKLVVRVAKKGENTGKTFWGCSAFPKCRYIKNETSVSIKNEKEKEK